MVNENLISHHKSSSPIPMHLKYESKEGTGMPIKQHLDLLLKSNQLHVFKKKNEAAENPNSYLTFDQKNGPAGDNRFSIS